MTNQKTLIHNTNWDVLIIIDACRYDYFKKYYKEFLGNKGNLQKVISPSEWSFGWMVETFGDKDWKDVVFLKSWVSGYILSKEEFDMESKDWKITDLIKRLKYQRYTKTKFFETVINMQTGKEYTALHPKVVDDYAYKAIDENPNKKIIIYYRQLHEPYFYWLDREKEHEDEPELWRENRFSKLYRFVYINFLQKILSSEQIWTITNRLGMQPNGPVGSLWLKHGWEGVKKGYTEDLKLVLPYVKKLIDSYPDKTIVVTSDHGELLGEHGKFGHEGNKRYKEIIEVPWFVVNGG